MTKKREKSEVEYLRGLVREQRAEIKHLKKQLGATHKQVKRYETHFEEQEEILKEEALDLVHDTGCPKCNAVLKYTQLGARALFICSECTYRKLVKK